jgi:hypothetical protein
MRRWSNGSARCCEGGPAGFAGSATSRSGCPASWPYMGHKSGRLPRLQQRPTISGRSETSEPSRSAWLCSTGLERHEAGFEPLRIGMICPPSRPVDLCAVLASASPTVAADAMNRCRARAAHDPALRGGYGGHLTFRAGTCRRPSCPDHLYGAPGRTAAWVINALADERWPLPQIWGPLAHCQRPRATRRWSNGCARLCSEGGLGAHVTGAERIDRPTRRAPVAA